MTDGLSNWMNISALSASATETTMKFIVGCIFDKHSLCIPGVCLLLYYYSGYLANTSFSLDFGVSSILYEYFLSIFSIFFNTFYVM